MVEGHEAGAGWVVAGEFEALVVEGEGVSGEAGGEGVGVGGEAGEEEELGDGAGPGTERAEKVGDREDEGRWRLGLIDGGGDGGVRGGGPGYGGDVAGGC